MLSANGLRKVYSSVVAVDDVSLSVARGEILGLLGPNGAGKTTSIRLIFDIIRPDSGQILFDGQPYSPKIANRIGYLPEERGLYRKNKLLNTLIYFATLKDMRPAEARRTAMEWLERFGLSSSADRKIEELSKGNQQKVQFIVSILHDPELVILDEPFSGLDPVNQIILTDVLMELRQRGKAIVFSTHMMEQAEKLCERITLINKGRVVLDGSLTDIKRQYGKNAVHLEYDGDGAFLGSLTGVRNVMKYEKYAELQLEDGVRGGEILRQISDRLAVRRFELMEPSLHSIFLEKVGASAAAEVRQ